MKFAPNFLSASAHCLGDRRRWRSLVLCGVVAGLTGCADVHWERTFYNGFRFTAEQCPLTRKPGDAPCAVAPAYDQYEKERMRAQSKGQAGQGEAGPSTPIEEKQL